MEKTDKEPGFYPCEKHKDSLKIKTLTGKEYIFFPDKETNLCKDCYLVVEAIPLEKLAITSR